MSKELIEQLREAAIYGPCPCPIADVAADRIEELERERDAFYMDYRTKCDEEAKDSALVIIERDQLRAELAAALAACKLKDEALYTCEVGDYSTGCVVPPSFDERKVEEALAIQPDDIVEMDWRLK